MLKQRVITALVMLSILLPAVFADDTRFFAGVALLLISAGAWEWARLNGYGAAMALTAGAICAVFCGVAWYFGVVQSSWKNVWIGASFFWVMFSYWLLRRGAAGWARVWQPIRLFGGLVALGLAWLAVVQARAIGINLLFSVLVLVWAADVFAYFSGRALGGKFIARKLAPSISPGKTWEGALGGMVGVLLVAFGWHYLEGIQSWGAVSLYGHLQVRGSTFMLISLVFLTMMSVVGDLVESLFKRHAGVKDSSALLPGHGGVLDRVDALLPVLPLAMMFVTL